MIGVLEKIGKVLGKWMTVVVLVVTAMGLLVPSSLIWIFAKSNSNQRCHRKTQDSIA